MGFIFVPLTTVSTATLPQAEIGNAAGIYNLMRNIGGGVGISIMNTLLSRASQAHQGYMVAHMTPYDPAYTQGLQTMQAAMAHVSGTADARLQGLALMYGQLQQQATLVAFVDVFRTMGVLCACAIPMVLMMKKVKAARGPVVVH
jgi:DHA2 family multidrug resistance protein